MATIVIVIAVIETAVVTKTILKYHKVQEKSLNLTDEMLCWP
jgi:hypothetical protein